jgi:hypothetical protein
MPSFKNRYDTAQKKSAIALLKNFADKIKKGELEVESSGWWQGVPGQYTLRVVVKESENSASSHKF